MKKIKKTIHSLKNRYHIIKISYILPQRWLPGVKARIFSIVSKGYELKKVKCSQSKHEKELSDLWFSWCDCLGG